MLTTADIQRERKKKEDDKSLQGKGLEVLLQRLHYA